LAGRANLGNSGLATAAKNFTKAAAMVSPDFVSQDAAKNPA
jgi:hypothetical protein